MNHQQEKLCFLLVPIVKPRREAEAPLQEVVPVQPQGRVGSGEGWSVWPLPPGSSGVPTTPGKVTPGSHREWDLMVGH